MAVAELDASYFEYDFWIDLLTQDKLGDVAWRVGTGSSLDLNNKTSLQKASENTFIITTAWGYSVNSSSDSRETPDVSFSCLNVQEDSKPNSNENGSPRTFGLSAIGLIIGIGYALWVL